MNKEIYNKLNSFIEARGDSVTIPKSILNEFLLQYIDFTKHIENIENNKRQYVLKYLLDNIDDYSAELIKILSSDIINPEKMIKNIHSKYNNDDILKMCLNILVKLNLLNRYYNSVQFTFYSPSTKERLYEDDLNKYLCNHIEIIEEGMKVIDKEVSYIDSNGKRIGSIDILTKDKNNRTCVIELKTVDNDRKLIYQCLAYPNNYPNCRIIVIAPSYSKSILKELNKLNDVEKMIYTIDSDYKLESLKIAYM